jgi:hypothetical protein
MTNHLAPPQRTMTDNELTLLLDHYWEEIALFAYEQFSKRGRGVVSLDRHGFDDDILADGIDLGYTMYQSNCPDENAAKMITEYDPEWEIVFQYLRPDGNVRTARIRTAPDNRHPWRIYLFDQLLQEGGD